MPKDNLISKELFFNVDSSYEAPWSTNTNKSPVLRRAAEVEWNLTSDRFLSKPTALVNLVPPWFNLRDLCFADFAHCPVADLAEDMVTSIFSAVREERFAGLLEIYTDASKHVGDGDLSVAAGMVVCLERGRHYENWRLYRPKNPF